jgi:hypothetical protein
MPIQNVTIISIWVSRKLTKESYLGCFVLEILLKIKVLIAMDQTLYLFVVELLILLQVSQFFVLQNIHKRKCIAMVILLHLLNYFLLVP